MSCVTRMASRSNASRATSPIRRAPDLLLAETQRRGIAIDVLVNNAGYGVTGSLVSRDWKTHAEFIEVMIAAPTALCHRFIPGMRARGFGRVVNVASFAGLMPAPAGHTLYAASKSYLIRFSEALALENRHHGINVCALCPGFTLSEFHDVTGSRKSVSKMPGWVWLDAREVARDGLDAVERGDRRTRRRRALPDDQGAVQAVARCAGIAADRGLFGQFPRDRARRQPISVT